MHGRWLFILLMLSTISCFANAELSAELPEDQPLVPEIVHNLAYDLTGTNLVEAGASLVAGDKFLVTKGFTLRDTYYFSQKIGLAGGLSFYTSAPTDEARALAAEGARPLMHDPSYIIRVSVLFQPVYGKLAIGSTIIRFLLGFEAGLHGANESEVFAPAATLNDANAFVVGPQAGARLHVPFSTRFSALARAEYLAHGGIGQESTGRKIWETTLGVGYKL